MERKFKKQLVGRGTAAQLRENVSQMAKATAMKTQRDIIEPLDYEGFVSSNMTRFRNDPHRELLLFPLKDIEVCEREQQFSTVEPRLEITAQRLANNAQPLNLYLETYTARLLSIRYLYEAYGGSYLQLPRFPKSVCSDPAVDPAVSTSNTSSSVSTPSAIICKCGTLLVNTDTSYGLFSRAYKRRYVSLRKGADESYILEMYKDSRCLESKGAIPLDLIAKVAKSPLRNRPSIELRTSASSGKLYTLSTDTDKDLDSWYTALSQAVAQTAVNSSASASSFNNSRPGTPTKSDSLSRTSRAKNSSNSSLNDTAKSATSAPSIDNQTTDGGDDVGDGVISNVAKLWPNLYNNVARLFDSMRGLEHSVNPQLARYARETDGQIADERLQAHQCVFLVYPDVALGCKPLSTVSAVEHTVTQPLLEKRGVLVQFSCNSLQFRLQTADPERSQVEPYITTLSVYDARQCVKLSEDFWFDINPPEMRAIMAGAHVSPPSGCDDHQQLLLPNLKCAPIEWFSSRRQAVFNVLQPHEDVYLFVRVDKVLQGYVSDLTDLYTHQTDSKHALKIQQQARQTCERLGCYRMPFVWSARPLFRSGSQLDVSSKFPALYRYEPGRMSEEDVIKLLQEWKRPDRMSRLVTVPGTLVVSTQVISNIPAHSFSPFWQPLAPFTTPLSPYPTLVLQSLPTSSRYSAVTVTPHTDYVNLLYVYPLRLKFDAQKAFKARNIACRVELRASDDSDAKPLQCFYSRPGQSAHFHCHQTTSVLYHDTTPTWCDELKLALPLQITPRHHLLFTFVHVSCQQQKQSKRGGGGTSSASTAVASQSYDSSESCVGYAWLPLLAKNCMNLDVQSIPVAATLPANYLSNQPLGLGKGYSGPEVRWLDGRRPLFRVSFRLVSSVHCNDQHLHTFLVHAQLLKNCRQVAASSVSSAVYASDTNLSNQIKTLHLLDANTLVAYLPTIMTQLLRICVNTTSKQVTANACRLLCHVLSTLQQVGRYHLVGLYIRHMMTVYGVECGDSTTTTTATGVKVSIGGEGGGNTVHEALCGGITELLQPANMDLSLWTKLYQHSSVLFDIIVKSMTLYLTDTGRIKMKRQERFPVGFTRCFQSMLDEFHYFIIKNHKDYPTETRQGNNNLASMLKRCLTLMDRGYVFRLIAAYLKNFSFDDPPLLWEYKFEFLGVICSHEHFVQLNLPLFNLPSSSFNSSEEFEREFMLTESFCSRHYLVGLIMHELRLALCQIASIRAMAITMLRALLVKHAYDDRYTSRAQRSQVASLFFPLISLLLENIHRFQPGRAKPQHQQNQGKEQNHFLLQRSPFVSSTTSMVSSCSNTLWNRADTNSTIRGSHSDLSCAVEQRSRQVSRVNSCRSVNSTVSCPSESDFLDFIAGPGVAATDTLMRDGYSTIGSARSSRRLDLGCGDSIDDLALSDTDTEEDTVVRRSRGSIALGSRDSTDTLVSQTMADNDRVMAAAVPAAPLRYDKFLSSEVRDLLVCFVHVTSQLSEQLLISWWRVASETDTINFFQLVRLSLEYFCQPENTCEASASTPTSSLDRRRCSADKNSSKSSTLPSYTSLSEPSAAADDLTNNRKFGSLRPLADVEMPPPSPSLQRRQQMLGLLSAEVVLSALDLITVYSCRFARLLQSSDGAARLRLICELYTCLLRLELPDSVISHVFAAVRMLLQRFAAVIYAGNVEMCSRLVYDLLRCCSSDKTAMRNEACAVVYLMIRGNFEFVGRCDISRLYLQIMVRVAELLGESVLLDTPYFYQSLALINNYANSDRAMRFTEFGSNVKELTRRIRCVLVTTSQMHEQRQRPAELLRLQLQMSNSYRHCPQLRETWLRSMTVCHRKIGNLCEAAMCELHISALMAECLHRSGKLDGGCHSLSAISNNLIRDESQSLSEDDPLYTAESLETDYSIDGFLSQLRNTASALETCRRFELLPIVYDVVIPLLRKENRYEQLSDVHHHLFCCYSSIVNANRSKHSRLLGTYYRVVFYGENFFDTCHERGFVYKEPNVTPLAEISEKLLRIYREQLGTDNVQLITQASQVDASSLCPRTAYIQVTHVVPYWPDEDKQQLKSYFERNHNVNQFMYEVPFTRAGGAHGSVAEQWRRRVILTTDYCLPYLSARVAVIKQQEYEMSPISVAIDEMESRTRKMLDVVSEPVDIKKLQLQLQGSVCVQVNAGALAYAEAFLRPSPPSKPPSSSSSSAISRQCLDRLRAAFIDFLYACRTALRLNASLHAPDQQAYHSSLQQSLLQMETSLAGIVGERVISVPPSSLPSTSPPAVTGNGDCPTSQPKTITLACNSSAADRNSIA